VLRKEDAELITGQGRYIDDVVLPGMLHLAFVRSPHAHAQLRGIDKARALEVDGVVAVLTADDLAFQAGVPTASNPTQKESQPGRWPLV
jgi:carbon-monoxide dehydrogenase large subunit